MNKTIIQLPLRAATLLAVLVFTILTASTEARADGGYSTDYYTLTLNYNYDGGGIQTYYFLSARQSTSARYY